MDEFLEQLSLVEVGQFLLELPSLETDELLLENTRTGDAKLEEDTKEGGIKIPP